MLMLTTKQKRKTSLARHSAFCLASYAVALFSLLLVSSSFAQETEAESPAPSAEAPAEIPPATTNDGAAKQADNDAELSVEQARLADRFKRLEEVIGRLAELSASSDPRRAKLLRDAIAQSRDQDLSVRFESIVKLLEEERLSAATNNQTQLQKELDGLLTLLLKADRDKELSSQRERVRKYLKEVSRLIREQKGIKARTEGGDELAELGKEQKRLADETNKLGGDIKETEGKLTPSEDAKSQNEDNKEKSGEGDKSAEGDESDKSSEPGDEKDGEEPSEKSEPGDQSSGEQSSNDAQSGESKQAESGQGKQSDSKSSEGKPSEGKSQEQKPSDSSQPGQSGSQSQDGDSQSQEQSQQQQQDPAQKATDQLQEAQKKMAEAQKKLEEAQRDGATEKQFEALRNLEQAKAELERVLRQLREEELERTLTQLVARFRKMLEQQVEVYEGTIRIDKIAEAERDHDDEIEAARLSRMEAQIVNEADRALLLLHEDGTSAAFPEALEQMRRDMRQITERLTAVKVDVITQGLEQDVIAALEETIATMEKAIKDLEKKKTPPGQQRAAGEPAEPPLVDKLAELKMIRSLQMRINTRTQRYGEMIDGEQAETKELIEALKDLADRQQRVYKATADLQQGRND